MPKDWPLQRSLVRKVPRPLAVPNPLSALHCLAGVPERHATGELPKRVEAEDDADLAAKWRDLEDHRATVRREALDRGRDREARGPDQRGGLPSQRDIGHETSWRTAPPPRVQDYRSLRITLPVTLRFATSASASPTSSRGSCAPM